MKINLSKINPLKAKCDVLFIPVSKENWLKDPLLLSFNEIFDGLLLEKLLERKFEAAFSDFQTFETFGKCDVEKIIISGIGKLTSLDSDATWSFYNLMAKQIKAHDQSVCIALNEHSEDLEHSLKLAPLGLLTGIYSFDKYKKPKTMPKNISFISAQEPSKNVKTIFEKGISLGKSINYSRDIVNTPTEDMTPEDLSKLAKEIQKKNKSIKVTVYDEKGINKIKMPLFMAVARASKNGPKLITFEYKHPKATNKKPIVVIGKGLMYDSGGLSIKPTESMVHMKADMGGAGAVMGLFDYIASTKPQCNVVGVIAACENSISGNAYRPGDIFKSRNGKSVEIVNTDAEGRLTLADAIDFAQEKWNPDTIIDMATLTGAAIVALGDTTVAMYSNSDDLAFELLEASEKAGEDFWRMPLTKALAKNNKGTISDLVNSGGRMGGSITAALFLQEFVKENVNWSHFDIAGPALVGSDNGHLNKGATGVAIATLTEFLELNK